MERLVFFNRGMYDFLFLHDIRKDKNLTRKEQSMGGHHK